MRIRFTMDFQGKLTNEVFYPKGTEADLDVGPALVALNYAEFVDAPEKAPKVERRPAKRARKGPKSAAGDE